MYSNFDNIKMDPQYYFSSNCVRLLVFVRLLEIKKTVLREKNVDFNIRGKKNVNHASLRGVK